MVTLWVVNASPVILLGKINSHELLQCFESQVVIPEAAVREIECQGPQDESVQALNAATWLKRIQSTFIPANIASLGLGDGESEVLAHALATPESGAIFDDQAARKAATKLGVPHLGTLGVILNAKMLGHIPLARPLVENLRTYGMYLSDRVMNRALAQVGE